MTSMMVDPEQRPRIPTEKPAMNRSKSELRMDLLGPVGAVDMVNEAHITRFEERKESQEYFDRGQDQRELTVPKLERSSDSAHVRAPVPNSGPRVAIASGRAPPREMGYADR